MQGEDRDRRLIDVRFIAPSRESLAAAHFRHPVFAGMQEYAPLLEGAAWPAVEEIDATLQPLRHVGTGRVLRLVSQRAQGEEKNYELRIFEDAVIPTRAGNWHDLLNALVWKKFPATKSAMNVGQVHDMHRLGVAERSRRQCALTQFDEGGAVLLVRDRRLLECWDRHDWTGLFLHHRDAWTDGRLQLSVVGHALLEHALDPHILLVSKTVAVLDEEEDLQPEDVDALVGGWLADTSALADPQDLRPLPLAGIPGWHPDVQDEDFYGSQPCFRPVRPGRRYPAPVSALQFALA